MVQIKTIGTEQRNPNTLEIDRADTAEIPASNDAGGAIIVNLNTHKVTAARNAEERLYPASTTKIMTVLVAQENIKVTMIPLQ